MSFESRIASVSKTRQVIEHLSQMVQDLSTQAQLVPAGPGETMSSTIAAIQNVFSELDQHMLEVQKQAKNEFDLALDRIGEGYVVLDRQGRYLEINPVARQSIYPQQPGNLVGHPISEIPIPLGGDQFRQQFEAAAGGNQPVHYEAQSTLDGRWYEVSGYPREDFVEFFIRDVTDRKEAQQAVERAARFPTENPNPVMRAGSAGQILFANPASQDLLAAYHCHDNDLLPEPLRWPALAALANNRTLVQEIPVRDEFYLFSIVPVPGQAYVNLYGSNITQRKQAEDGLRESHQRLEMMLENITEAYFVLDDQWRILDYNPTAAREIFKRPKESLLGKRFWDEYPEAVGNTFYEQYNMAFDTGQPVHFEALSAITASWYEVHAYPHSGRLEIYLHNIDDRKQAEQNLLRSHTRLEVILESLTEAFISYDEQWRIQDINPVAAQLFFEGRPAAEILGIIPWEIYPDSVAGDFYPRFLEAVAAHQPVHFEGFAGRAQRWFETHCYPRDGRLDVYMHDITSRKQAETERERLLIENQQQKDLLEAIFALDPGGIAVVSEPDLVFRMVNPAYRGFIPNPDEDIIGRSVADIWPPDQGFPIFAALEQVLTTDAPYRIQNFRMVTSRGSARSFNMVIRRVIYQGRPAALIFTWDLTEIQEARRQAEQSAVAAALAASDALRREQELETILNAMNEALTIYDAQGQLIRANPAAARYFGEDPVGLNQHDLTRLLHILGPDEQPIPPDRLPSAMALRGENVTNLYTRLVNANGQAFDTVTSAVPLYHLGKPGGCVVVWRDITDQERLNRQLAVERARIEAVLQQMPAGVLIADAQTGELIMRNHQIEEIMLQPVVQRLSINQEVGYQGLHTNGQPYQIDEWPIYRAIHAGEVVQGEEICVPRPNGDDLYISVNAAPIYGADNQIDAGVSIFFDITDRRRAELNNRFLAQLGEKLIKIKDPAEIKAYTARALGEYLGASRCVLDEVKQKQRTIKIEQDYARDLPSLAGQYRFSPLHEQLAGPLSQGHIQVNRNTAVDPLTADLYQSTLDQLGIRSYVAIPRFTEAGWQATLTVMDDRPRDWRIDEIQLIRSASDLVWLGLEAAILLKNVQETTERLNVALKNAPIMVHSLDRNLRYTWVYKPPLNFTIDEIIGKRYDELVPPEQVRELMDLKQSVLESGERTRHEARTTIGGVEQILDVTLEPLRGTNPDDIIGLTVAAIDITPQRRMEVEMLERAAKIEIQSQILRHRELERLEVAQDLHDGPLQEMIGLNFAINEIPLIDDAQERLQAIENIQNMLQKQIADVRAFCYELRPPTLTPFGLERAIRSHLEQFQKKNPQIKIHSDLKRDGKILPEDLRLALFRAYQEALNNVVRHAEASEVWLRFDFNDQRALLEIRDNGKGFKVPNQWVQLAREGHLGVVGMHERIEATGGNIQINSQPGQGTQVSVTLPIKSN